MLNVHVSNLGKYNEGFLVGEWISLPATEEEIKEVLKKIGINNEYEESFNTDWEWEDNEIKGFPIGEYSSLTHLSELLTECDLTIKDMDIFNAVFNAVGSFDESFKIYSEENFFQLRSIKTKKDLGHALVHEIRVFGEINEDMEGYFDYESVVDTYGMGYMIDTGTKIAIETY